jgi:DNA-binding CsgD family transcriptional regulator
MVQSRIWQEFIDATYDARDEVTIAHATHRLTNALGFRWFAYMSLGASRPALMSTYPSTWTDHYLANRFDQIDPVIVATRKETSPFFWGRSTHQIRPTAAEAIRLFDDAASFGIKSGITVPFRGPKGHIASLTLTTDERSLSLERHAEEIMSFVQVCGLQLHNHLSSRAPRFMPPHRSRILSKRQRLCLAASANGQSAKEIARIVGLTPRTVEFHLEEAKRRLNAETLPHAVALAVKQGLIP